MEAMISLPKVLLVSLVLLVGVAPALAQENTSSDDELSPRGSNRAISFTLDALSLRSLDGGIGGKLWFSPTTALRSSLNFSVASDEDVVGEDIDIGRSAVSGGVSFLIELHSLERGRISPYLGSGFSIGGSAFSQTTNFNPDNTRLQTRMKGSSLDFTVDVALGMEVRLAQRISLAGEHVFTASVRDGSTTDRERFREAETIVTERNFRNFELRTGTTNLILSVYF